MKPMTPKKPSDLFIKAGIFGIFFLIVLIFFMIASKNVKSVETGSKILNGVTRYKGFSEKEKDGLKLRNAGFWQYASDSASTINVSDRIELKTNGIFWQVTQYTINLPSGRSTRFMHVITGYMNPFCMLAANNKDSILCDVHTIKQSIIMGKDTCYAPSNVDTTWCVVANGERFGIGDRNYARYDTAGAALFRFFPEGALNIVDKITLLQSPPGSGFISFAKKAIISDMELVKVDVLTKDAIQKIVDAYYRDFIETIVSGAPQDAAAKNKAVKIEFDVASNGKTSNARVDASALNNKKLEPAVLAEVNSWVFPSVKQPSAALHIQREFWF